MSARTGFAAMVAAVGLLTASCAGESASVVDTRTAATPPATYDQQRRGEVAKLLDDWAIAVRSGDGDAVRRLIDPRADAAFVDAQVQRAETVPSVPFADFGYELGDEPETPVPSALAEPLDAADVWAPSVYLRYAIEGPDTDSTRSPVSLVVAERDGVWRLVDDGDLPQYRRHTWRGPWDFGPVVVQSVPTAAGSSVVIGHEDKSQLISQIADGLPADLDAVADFWGDDWSRDTVVFVASAAAEFGESTGSAATTDVAAVTVSDPVSGDGTSPTGQRVVFGPEASTRLTPTTVRSVLRHELTHVAARSRTVDGSPLWVLEGFADYSGYRGTDSNFARIAPTLSSIVSEGGPPTVLPRDADFAASGTRAGVAYESAWSIFAFVADRFGEAPMRSLYEGLASGPQSDATIDTALKSVLGVGRAQFIADWGDWVVARSS